jgi:hypothetical protein
MSAVYHKNLVIVDTEAELDARWKIGLFVFVLETNAFYVKTDTNVFTQINTPPSAGEINTASNVTDGGGVGIFKDKSSVDLRFKSLVAGSGIQISGNANDVQIINTRSAPDRHLIVLDGDVASSASTSFQNITGLSFPVIAGQNYRWQAVLLYTTSAATIGLRVSLTAPAFTHNAYITQTPIAVAGSASNLWGNGASAADTGTTSTGSMNTTGGNILVATGIIRPSADGTVQLRFAPETATANGVIIEAGSTLEWW